ncbi:hypothetical protein OSB04_031973 [Centaurea solstitialis]|uniref:Polyprotein n=1 Tax=Centaurea solstitialis TaxID=347529 RepID=A0AA38W592_9ASTR|nr:hypothetical protein OSB04_031973 [Centaurea solstitialis]
MTGTLELLSSNIQQEGNSIAFRRNQKGKIKGYGMIVKGEVKMNQVSYVDGLKHNLISVSQLCDNGLDFMFKIKYCIMYKADTLIEIMRAYRRGDLYLICFEALKAKEEICLVSSVKNEEAWLWHTRFCHLNFHTLDKLVRLKLVKGLPDIKFEKDHLCSSCEMGKLRRSSHKTKSDPSYDKPLQMLHVHLCGPISVQSLGGKKYILVLIDEISRFTWVEFMKNSQVPLILINILKRLQVLHGLQNGVVERKKRTLVEAARTMLNASGLPLTFWAEAVSAACYTQNKSLVVKRFEKTPYQLLHNKRPNIKLFHVFGCKCYVLNDREPIGKFDPKGDDAIFIGYSWDSITYRVNDESDPDRAFAAVPRASVEDHPVTEASPQSIVISGPSTPTSTSILPEVVQSSTISDLPPSQAPTISAQPTSDTTQTIPEPIPISEPLEEINSTINLPHATKNKKDEQGVVVRNKARLVDQRGSICQATPGFESAKYANHVYFLDKAMYGLKQAPRAWYERLSTFLTSNEFHRGTTYITLFYKKHDDDILLVQIYVDDIIFGSTDISMCKDFESLMQKEFEMSKTGELTFFLGLQVKQSSEGIFINQSTYANDLLKKYQLHDASPMRTPMALLADLTSCFQLVFVPAYTNSDYGGCQVDRKSTSRSCQFLGGKLVSWSSKKQNCVSTSTAEAEYVAAARCYSQALWMQTQLRDYGYSLDKIPILCSASGNQPHGDEEVDQTYVSTLAAKFLSSGYEKMTLTKKSNNHYLAPKTNGFPENTDLMIQVLRNHPLRFALTSTTPIAETNVTKFLFSSYGMPSIPDLEALALDEFDPTPSDEELMGFLRFLNYRVDDKHLGLAIQISILNCCLTGKVGGHDKSSSSILPIMYGIFFNLHLDFVDLIFEDMVGLIRKKCATQTLTPDQRKDPSNLEFKPTINPLGYDNPRPMSKAMLKHLERSSRKAYISGYRRPESVPVTPPRIGTPLGESDSPRNEGVQEVPTEAGDRVLEREENMPKRVDRSEDPSPKKRKKKAKRKDAEVVVTETVAETQATEIPVAEVQVLEEQTLKRKRKHSKAKKPEGVAEMVIPEDTPYKKSKKNKKPRAKSPEPTPETAPETTPTEDPTLRTTSAQGPLSPIQEEVPPTIPR